MPTMSTITICALRSAPGKFSLIREDFPEPDKFVWCGTAMGWRPYSERIHRHLFGSMDAARKAAKAYVTWPLPHPLA